MSLEEKLQKLIEQASGLRENKEQGFKVWVREGEREMGLELAGLQVYRGRTGGRGAAEAPSDLSLGQVKKALEDAKVDMAKIEVLEGEGLFIVRPTQGTFLGDAWGGYNDVVRPLGFQWSRETKRWQVAHANAAKGAVPDHVEKEATLEDAYKAIEESGFMDVLNAEAKDGLVRINIKGSLGGDYNAVRDALGKHGFTYNRDIKNCFTAKLKGAAQGPRSAPSPPAGGGASSEVEPITHIQSRHGVLLAKCNVKGRDVSFDTNPDIDFSIYIPPFESFLVGRVLESMKTTDRNRLEAGEIEVSEALDFSVSSEDDVLRSITVINYGGERRLREIISSVRWTLDKMYDKVIEAAPEDTPTPDFKRATGEMILPGAVMEIKSQLQSIPLSDTLKYEMHGDRLWIIPTKFLGDSWGLIRDEIQVLRPVDWRDKHFEIYIPPPLDKPDSIQKPPEDMTVEDIIEEMQGLRTDVSRSDIKKMMEVEKEKAAGLLTELACAHLVWDSLKQGVAQKQPDSEEALGAISIELVERMLDAERMKAHSEVIVTEDNTTFQVEPLINLSEDEVAEYTKILRPLNFKLYPDGQYVRWIRQKPKKK